jgi:hypothetical protein
MLVAPPHMHAENMGICTEYDVGEDAFVDLLQGTIK